MKNFIQPGKYLTLALPYDRTSGEGFLVGSLFAVASTTALSGANVEGATEGVFELAKVGSQAWTVGAPIYWDDTNKHCTATASTHKRIGKAVAAVGSGAGETLGKVKLEPVSN